jgi:hypothetical protein
VTPTASLLKQLEEKAKRATPGPYEVIRFDNSGGAIDYQVETEIRQDGDHVIVASFREFGNPKHNKADAELHARLDPQTVLSLIARIRELEGVVEGARSLIRMDLADDTNCECGADNGHMTGYEEVVCYRHDAVSRLSAALSPKPDDGGEG